MRFAEVKKRSLPVSLDDLVVSLCRDYKRRESSALSREVTGRTVMEYKYINSKMREGASEIVGGELAGAFITEIGDRTGYAYSLVGCLSESTYKLMKQEVKLNIAKKLHLLD